MASDKGYLEYILDGLSLLDGISYRAMMGEYILYYQGRIIGGVYDNRLLIKPVAAARKLLPDAPLELPYEGAKPMLLVIDTDDSEKMCKLFNAVLPELPEPKKRKG